MVISCSWESFLPFRHSDHIFMEKYIFSQVVEWLIKLVHHLPSDELCHKILMSIVDDKEKEVVVQQRSKCLAIIQEVCVLVILRVINVGNGFQA